MKKFRDMTDAELLTVLGEMIDYTVNDSRDAKELKTIIEEWNSGFYDERRWPIPVLVELANEKESCE